jgi:site-specific recombinase XerD
LLANLKGLPMSAKPPRPRRRRLETVREVCEEYLARALAGKTGAGWKTRRAEITRFIADRGDIAVDDLIADDLEKWIEDRPALASGHSKKRVAQTIKCCFSWCWKKGLIGSHPLKGVAYQPGERWKPMAEEYFRKILRSVTAEYRRALLFLWWTGARPGELAALKWTSIDCAHAVAVLEDHKTKHSRADGAPRVICLPENAVRLLTWILKDQEADQEFVFLNSRGNPWHRCELTRRLRRLRARLGIPADVKLYGCRHGFGTRLALAGVELKTLSTLMGHTNTRQTEHYIHIANEAGHLHSALEKALAPKKKD